MAKPPITHDQLPKGISLHRGKLRIAFRPNGFPYQVKRVLDMEVTKSNIKIAEMKLNAIRHEIMLGTFEIGKHFPNDPLSREKPYTITELLADLNDREDSVGHVKNSTRRLRMATLERLCRKIGSIDIRRVSKSDAEDIRKKLREGGRSPRAVNLDISLLKRATRIAVERQKIDACPFSHLLPLSTVAIATSGEANETDLDVYTIAEADLIIAAAPEGFYRNLFEFCFWSGLRHGEALALERRDLELPYITVRRTLTRLAGETQTPKTGDARRILLPKRAVSAVKLQLRIAESERIFSQWNPRANKSTQTFPRVTWNKVIKSVGLRKLKPYTTRHSFISWMLMAGESDWKVAHHVGHANTNMIQRVYGHFIPNNEPKWSLDDPKIF